MAANRAGAHARFDADLFRGQAGEQRARLMIGSTNPGCLLPAACREIGDGARHFLHGAPERRARGLDPALETDRRPPPTLLDSSRPFDLSVTTPGAHMEGPYSDLLTLELSAL